VDEENISATFKSGILTVVLPKTEEAQPKQRTIKIK
jgi:HSP20 family molecular chaperone IbpA